MFDYDRHYEEAKLRWKKGVRRDKKFSRNTTPPRNGWYWDQGFDAWISKYWNAFE